MLVGEAVIGSDYLKTFLGKLRNIFGGEVSQLPNAARASAPRSPTANRRASRGRRLQRRLQCAIPKCRYWRQHRAWEEKDRNGVDSRHRNRVSSGVKLGPPGVAALFRRCMPFVNCFTQLYLRGTQDERPEA